MTTFMMEVFQNKFLPVGGSDVNAVVSVRAFGQPETAFDPSRTAVMIMIDVSGSMRSDKKLASAIAATQKAIDCLHDGCTFGVIAGADIAYQAFPPPVTGYRFATASPTTKAEAKAAVSRLVADGGTAFGTWLEAARTAFQTTRGQICQALLLTDGRNEHETDKKLMQVLDRCRGVFECHCRGVGTDWVVDQLRHISSTLLGSVEIVAHPENLTKDFQQVIESAMSKQTQHVALRVWTPDRARVSFVKQVAPETEDLTHRRVAVSDLAGDYPTAAWGTESRDYYLSISVPPAAAGDEMLAGRISLVVDGVPVSEDKILATWTDDGELSTRIDRHVAHYNGQVELADAIRDGLDARQRGDEVTATSCFGRAVQLAHAGGNEGSLRLLANVVDISDASTGTVRLKAKVADVDVMTLDTRSTKTVRFK